MTSMIPNKRSYQNARVPNVHPFKKLKWWLENLHICNGWCLLQQKPQIFIHQNTFRNGWGILSRCFHRGRVGGVVKRAAEIIHKCLGSISNKTASAFIYQEIIRSMHLKIDNKVALRYLLKRRGGCNQCNTVKNKQENGEHTSLKKISIYQLQLPT